MDKFCFLIQSSILWFLRGEFNSLTIKKTIDRKSNCVLLLCRFVVSKIFHLAYVNDSLVLHLEPVCLLQRTWLFLFYL